MKTSLLVLCSLVMVVNVSAHERQDKDRANLQEKDRREETSEVSQIKGGRSEEEEQEQDSGEYEESDNDETHKDSEYVEDGESEDDETNKKLIQQILSNERFKNGNIEGLTDEEKQQGLEEIQKYVQILQENGKADKRADQDNENTNEKKSLEDKIETEIGKQNTGIEVNKEPKEEHDKETKAEEKGDRSEVKKEDKNEKEMKELFCLDNVHLFSLASQTSEPLAEGTKRLRVIRLPDGKLLLHIEEYMMYPLLPNITPVALSDDGVIILPDLRTRGAAVGLKMPAAPGMALIHILYDGMPPRQKADTKKLLDKLEAKMMVYQAENLANSLVSRAQRVSGYIDQRAARLRLSPPAEGSSHRLILSGAHHVSTATGKMAGVTGWATKYMDKAQSRVADTIGSRIHAGAVKVGSRLFKSEGKGPKPAEEMTVAGTAALSRLMEAVGKSTNILTQSLRDNTVQVVTHRYGEEMVPALDDVFKSAKNTLKVFGHVKSFSPHGVILTTATHIASSTVGSPSANQASEQYVCADPTMDAS